MLVLSTIPNSAYLLHLALFLLRSSPSEWEKAIELVEMTDAADSNWELKFRISNIIASEGNVDKAEKIIDGMDVEQCVCQSTNSGIVKIILETLISLGRLEKVTDLLKLSCSADRLSNLDNCRLRFKMAEALIAEGKDTKAQQILSEIDVKATYAENHDLTDIYARIGWAIYWPKNDCNKVIEWIEKDLGITDPAPSIPDTSSTASRLSPAWRVNYAQVLAKRGDIAAAEKQVDIAYKEDPGLKDGYARTAWQYFNEIRDFQSLVAWIRRDADKNRMSPSWQLNYARAVAKAEGMEAALPLIEKTCHESPNLKDAFGQIAWTCYISEDLAYEKVIPFLEIDMQNGRLSGEWQLNYAQALLATGHADAAERQVENAYRNYSSLNNGYARCGLTRYFNCAFEPQKALKWFERDLQQGRLNGVFDIYYAILLAATGNMDAASEVVEKAYAENPGSKNGYASIGWYFHVVRNQQPSSAFTFFERDIEIDRLLPNAKILYAGLYAYAKNRNRAEKIVSNCYACDRSIFGGNLIIGLCDYAHSRDLKYLMKMIDKDEGLGRLPIPYMKYIEAAAVLKTRDISKTFELLKKIAVRSSQTPAHAESWMKRIYAEPQKGIKEFITPELEKMFYFSIAPFSSKESPK